MKYTVVNDQHVKRAGLDSLFRSTGSGAPRAPRLGDIVLDGQLAEIQFANAVVIVAPLGVAHYGIETKLDAVALAKFVRFYGLRPEQVYVFDLGSQFEFDWSITPWTSREYEEMHGVRLSEVQVAKLHAEAVAADLELVSRVTLCLTLPRHCHALPLKTMMIPDLGGDLGTGEGEFKFDVVAQLGSDPMQQEVLKRLRIHAKETAQFAPGAFRARVFGIEQGEFVKVDEAALKLIEETERQDAPRHFAARVEDHLDGEAIRSAKAVVIGTRYPELPTAVWEAFSAGRPVVLVGPEPVLPFADQIDYNGLLFRLRPTELPKLGKLIKAWILQRTDDEWRETGKRARIAYEKAVQWRALFANATTK